MGALATLIDMSAPDLGSATVRPQSFDERFRLYLDESGDHVFNKLDQPQHRFLCLLGCWFKNPDYVRFQDELEQLKRTHLPHHPDEPVVLHREDIVNRRGIFARLQSKEIATTFDDALLKIVAQAEFRLVAVVIDKLRLKELYGDAAAHPYHLATGFMLQRYCGFLNHVNRVGDVMAEARGRKEDQLLADSYTRHFEQGAWTTPAEAFQNALTSRQLKLKTKSANIAGLQLADLLGHPVRLMVVRERKLTDIPAAPFAERLLATVSEKFNRHLYEGRLEGYGTVFFPK